MVLSVRPAQAEHGDGQQIVIPDGLDGFVDQMFLQQTVPGDGILPVFWWVHANPDGIDLLDLLVVETCERSAILGRNYAAAIVHAALYQWVAGVKIVLCLYVNDKADDFPRARAEGVNKSQVTRSIVRALDALKKYLKSLG